MLTISSQISPEICGTLFVHPNGAECTLLMRRLAGSWIFLLVLIALDFYVFQAVKTILVHSSPRLRWVVYVGYWTVSAVSIALMLSITFTSFEGWHKLLRTYAFATVIGLFLAKLLASVFFLADDLRRVVMWSYQLLVPPTKSGAGVTDGLTRSQFLSWLGVAMGTGLFGSLLYGFGNKYRYQLEKMLLPIAQLPKSFKGFRIVHISDIHSGSFTDAAAVQKGIEKINAQEPDLILFTGDLVNYAAEEMQPYMHLFSKLSAKHGVYATLGNHDYGFPQAETREARTQMQLENALQVKAVHEKLGWKTLSNTHAMIEKDGERIALLGVDNISAKVGFPSFGNLAQAYAGSEAAPVKILLSHDPSHWDKEVRQYPDIHLTLSGHTHGMQFGVSVPGFRWSPVQYVYRQWAGLYSEKEQHLYVNRGFGFIGYPGRVGMLPEITVIELA